MIYRTNAYQPAIIEPLPFWERLSYKIAGHPNFFFNLRLKASIALPIWAGLYFSMLGILTVIHWIFK